MGLERGQRFRCRQASADQRHEDRVLRGSLAELRGDLVDVARVLALLAPVQDQRARAVGPARDPAGDLPRLAKLKKVYSVICKFLAGSFSVVSKRNFARKYVFDSIFQDLQDFHTFAPL